MKKLLLLLIITLTGCAMHHRLPLPAVQFQYVDTRINPYVKMLHLKDSNALILKVVPKYRYEPYNGDFLVKDSKGDISFYMLLTGHGHDTILYSKKLPKTQRDTLMHIFNQAAEIDKSVVEKYNAMDISDDIEVELELFQNQYHSKISSYALEHYIEQNIGAEERKKMLAVVKKVNRVNYLPTKNITDIENLDTIYVHFTYGKMQSKEPYFKSQPHKTYTFYTGSHTMDFFYQPKADSVKVSRSFLKTHNKQIVDYFFFLKNNANQAGFRKRTIMIIDDNGKDMYLKQVAHGKL